VKKRQIGLEDLYDMTLANGVQPVAANFFTSIGKAARGVLMSLTRQIIFLLPLVLIFPRIWGLDGVMYAGPVADREFLDMARLEASQARIAGNGL
jgi:hypothetical protein